MDPLSVFLPFGFPIECRSAIDDNTGNSAHPLEGSTPLSPDQRFHYLNHLNVTSQLTGHGLDELVKRFLPYFEEELEGLCIGKDWVEIGDFYGVVKKIVFNGTINALCGPHLLRLNPGLTDDFWVYDGEIMGAFKGLPRWMIPKMYEVRERILEGIEKWHGLARKNVDVFSGEMEGVMWEEFYGTKLVRMRTKELGSVKGMNGRAMAATDLAIIWG